MICKCMIPLICGHAAGDAHTDADAVADSDADDEPIIVFPKPKLTFKFQISWGPSAGEVGNLKYVI